MIMPQRGSKCVVNWLPSEKINTIWLYILSLTSFTFVRMFVFIRMHVCMCSIVNPDQSIIVMVCWKRMDVEELILKSFGKNVWFMVFWNLNNVWTFVYIVFHHLRKLMMLGLHFLKDGLDLCKKDKWNKINCFKLVE